MKNHLKSLALVYIAYLGFSLFFILPLLNLGTPWVAKKLLDRELSADFIYFNPFNLGLVVYNARLPNRDGSDFVSLGRAEVNLCLESVYRKGLVLDVVSVASLKGHIERLEDGRFTFQDLLEGEPEAEPEATDAGIFPLTVHHLAFQADRIELTDHDREQPFKTHWDDIDLEADFLSTVFDEDRQFEVLLQTEEGGEIEWRGTLSIPGASSAGTLSLRELNLRPASRFVDPWFDFALASGYLHVKGRYELDWSEGVAYRISDGQVSLTGLDIVPAADIDLPGTRVGLEGLHLRGITVDSQTSTLKVAQLEVATPRVEGYSEGAEVSLLRLFNTGKLPTGDGQPEAAPEDDTGPEWHLSLEETRLQGGQIAWQSEFTEPPMTRVDDLAVTLGALQWPAASATPLAGSLRLNDAARLSLEGALHLGSGNGEIAFEIAGIQAPWFSPAVPEAFRATIDSGELASRGRVALAGFSPTTVDLEGSVRRLYISLEEEQSLTEGAEQEPGEGTQQRLTGWESLYWEGLAIDIPGQRVALDTLRLDAFVGRMHIYADGTFNTQRALQQELEKAEVDTEAAVEAAGHWQYAVNSIQLTESEIDFMDESLPIPFRTVIGDLGGEVTGLSSEPGKSATVDISGTVDGYAPVQLSGSVSPLVESPSLDLGLSFKGVDLARLTPYSGTYAGYAIDRGVLDLDVRYRLEDSKLKGDNSVVIAQLKLGDKVASEKAVDVPLELGIALLTDVNGVIDIAVPVSGDVNDPDFSLASVISGAFVNLITKAVTAPFKLLANLVGSEEDLQRINFPAGSSEPDEAGRQKLVTLGGALAQRPAITLLIDGRVNPELDRERLQKAALREQLVAEGLAPEEVESKGPEWEAAIRRRYRAIGTGGDDGEPSLPQQFERVAAAIELPDSALQELALERAVAAKRILVNEGALDPDRAAVDSVDLAEEGHQFGGVELDIND